jgi:hypothetical protein
VFLGCVLVRIRRLGDVLYGARVTPEDTRFGTVETNMMERAPQNLEQVAAFREGELRNIFPMDLHDGNKVDLALVIIPFSGECSEVVLLAAHRPDLLSRPQEWAAHRAVARRRTTRAGMEPNHVSTEGRQFREESFHVHGARRSVACQGFLRGMRVVR